jgi:hypothetical protein
MGTELTETQQRQKAIFPEKCTPVDSTLLSQSGIFCSFGDILMRTRNAYLQDKAVGGLPKATKTGTTIVGIIFKVQIPIISNRGLWVIGWICSGSRYESH